jgi:chromosome segregation ATPase
VDTNNDNKPENSNSGDVPQVNEEPKVQQQSVDGVIAPQQPESTPVNITSDGEITDKPIEQPPTVDKEAFEKAVAAEEAAEASKQAAPVNEVVSLKKRIKKLKMWLAVIVILLVAVGSALAVYFYSQNQVNSDLKAAQAENADLQQQLAQSQNAATEQTISALNAELEAAENKVAELEAEVTELKTLNEELFKLATDLKTKCGAACSTTEIPEDTTDSTEQ